MEQQGIKPYVIGLDLGGTNSVFGIVDARGEIKATTAIKMMLVVKSRLLQLSKLVVTPKLKTMSKLLLKHCSLSLNR